MKEQTEFYMIRRKSDGFFSKGGARPTFSKRGKKWNTIGHIKNHLSLFIGYKYDGTGVYEDCELVVFKMVVNEDRTESLGDLIQTYWQEKKDREALKRLRWQKQKTEKEIEKYEELKKKYGDN